MESIVVPGQQATQQLFVEEGMARIIHENINARLHLTLTDRQGELLFEGTGMNAGLEIVDPGDSHD